MSAAGGRQLFSPEELASWSRMSRQEVLAELHKRDSWCYAFDECVARPGPDGLAYELARRSQDPPGRSYATKAATSHSLTHLSLPAPPAAVAHGCVALPTSRQYRAMLAHVFGDSLVDGALLQVAERPTPLDPFHFVGVAYVVLKAHVLRPRAFVLLEHSGAVADADGALVVFKVTRSLPVDAAALARVAPTSRDFELGETYMTLLLRSSDAGRRTDLRAQTMLRRGGTGVSGWAAGKFGHPFVESLERLGTVGASRVLQDRLRAPKRRGKEASDSSSRSSSSAATACRVCKRRRPRLGVSARQCAACERLACKGCTLQLPLLAADGASVAKTRVCASCVRAAQTAAGRADSPSTVSGATSSRASDRDPAEWVVHRPRSASAEDCCAY